MDTDPTPDGPQGRDHEASDRLLEDLRRSEARLRQALGSEASRITPDDRLTAILTEAHAAPGGSTSRHWLAPVAAAAATIVLAGSIWTVTGRDHSTLVGGPTVAATSTRSTTSQSGTAPTSNARTSIPTLTAPPTSAEPASPTTTAPSGVAPTSATAPPSTKPPGSTPTVSTKPPTSAPSTTAVTPPSTALAAVPVYLLGPASTGSSDLRLFRQFIPTDVVRPSSPEHRAMAALLLAMGPANAAMTSGSGRSSGQPSPWVGIRPESVSVDSGGGGRIAVRLSAGLSAAPAGGVEKAIQQLVWTAQGAAGQGAVPVRLDTADGSDVAPGVPSGRDHNRPTDPIDVAALLSPVWVDAPFHGQHLASGRTVRVSGVSSTFEATVQWRVTRAREVVREGTLTATAGAPARGTYAFELPGLPDGEYVVVVFETSAKDGSVRAEERVPFTIG